MVLFKIKPQYNVLNKRFSKLHFLFQFTSTRNSSLNKEVNAFGWRLKMLLRLSFIAFSLLPLTHSLNSCPMHLNGVAVEQQEVFIKRKLAAAQHYAVTSKAFVTSINLVTWTGSNRAMAYVSQHLLLSLFIATIF